MGRGNEKERNRWVEGRKRKERMGRGGVEGKDRMGRGKEKERKYD